MKSFVFGCMLWLASMMPAGAAVYPAMFVSLMGSGYETVSTTTARGGVYAQYEAEFAQYEASHWTTDGANWEAANYYDRAAIDYIWWQRSANVTYLNHANALALNYRTQYLEPNNYGAPAHWAQMKGVAMHYAMTGDLQSQKAVGAVADIFCLPYYQTGTESIGTHGSDNRQQARVLTGLIYALKTGAPSIGIPATGVPGGNDYAAILRGDLNKILSTQDADGAYRFVAYSMKASPFTMGLLNDALIEYWNLFEKDTRIPTAIKKSVDWMRENVWDSSSQSFQYLEGTIEPAPDLNQLIVTGFDFTYGWSRIANYKTWADEAFAGGVNGANLAGSKQFNQSYVFGWRHPYYTR